MNEFPDPAPALRAMMVPPWAATNSRTTVGGDIPIPVSDTVITMRSSACVTDSPISAPSLEYFEALSSRSPTNRDICATFRSAAS